MADCRTQIARGLLKARDVFASTVATLIVLVTPAAAQPDGANQVLCGDPNIGMWLTFIFGLFMLGFLIHGAFRLMAGTDKQGSTKKDVQQRGKEQSKGAGYSFAAAAVPPLLGALFEYMGVSMVSCIDFDFGVWGNAILLTDAIPTLALIPF